MEESWFAELNTKVIGRKVRCFPKTTSTNDLAWLEVSRGAADGTTIFAGTQIKGRGRMDRTWFSPADKGIWSSIIIKPNLPVEEMPLLMCFSAVALCDLLQREFSLPALIRWPNDIMINNQKIGGILVESRLCDNSPEASIIGIGLNVNIATDEIPKELQGEMTSLLIAKGEKAELRALARILLCYLDLWYDKLLKHDYSAIKSEWQRLSSVLNKKVVIREGNQVFTGEVIELDPYKGIMLRLDSNPPAGRAGETRVFRGECIESLRMTPLESPK